MVPDFDSVNQQCHNSLRFFFLLWFFRFVFNSITGLVLPLASRWLKQVHMTYAFVTCRRRDHFFAIAPHSPEHTYRFLFMFYWPIGILSGAASGRRKSEWIKIQTFFCFVYYFIQIKYLFSIFYISWLKKYSWSLLIKRKIWGPFIHSTCEEIACAFMS